MLWNIYGATKPCGVFVKSFVGNDFMVVVGMVVLYLMALPFNEFIGDESVSEYCVC